MALRVSAFAVLVSLTARAIVLAVIAAGAVTLPQILHLHDGHEYFQFAEAIANGTLTELPRDARRHEPGWPLLLAPLTGLPLREIAVVALMWLLLIGSTVLFTRILLRETELGPNAAAIVAVAFGVSYPAHVYYQSFALGEALFTFCVLAATEAFLLRRLPLAFAVAGIAAIVRTPGIFLPVSFAFLLVLRRDWRSLAFSPIALLPQFAWNAYYYHIWRETPAQVLAPKLAFPLASYAHVFDQGKLRGIYQGGIALFFCITIARLFYQAAKVAANPMLEKLGASFVTLFFLFHASIYSMEYLGTPVYACHYMDRYMVGTLPFVALAWRGFLTWPVVAFAAAASLGLSIYWGRNFLTAVGLG